MKRCRECGAHSRRGSDVCDLCGTPFASTTPARSLLLPPFLASLVVGLTHAFVVAYLTSVFVLGGLPILVAVGCGRLQRRLDSVYIAIVAGTTISASLVTLAEPNVPKSLVGKLATVDAHWPAVWLGINVAAVLIMLVVATIAHRTGRLDYNETSD